MWSTLKYNRIVTIIILCLIFVLGFLQIFPQFDFPIWEIDWFVGYTGLTQYYVGLFCSIMAFIVGFSLNEISKKTPTGRSILISAGFFILSGFLFINSVTTPYLIFHENTGGVSAGSLQLGLFLSSILFVLAGSSIPQIWQERLIKYRRLLWLFLILLVVVYFSFGFTNIAEFVPQYLKVIQNLTSILLLCWASWLSLRLFMRKGEDFDYKMSASFLLLAIAETAVLSGLGWHLSWSLYIPSLLLAFFMAIIAVLGLIKSSSNVPLVRYFTILGITLIVAFSIANVELGMQWIPAPVNRTWLIPFVLAQGMLSFVVLLFIVIYLNRLIKHHTDALHREQHQRAELTQLIVHDLKSPLTVILSGMGLLNQEHIGPLNEGQKRLLTNLTQSGHDVLFMINDLLDVEKLEEGKLQLVESSFDPVRLVQERVEELQIVASTHQQTLSLTHDAKRPLIRADKRLIQRVINNLISNALKFTPNEGTINISINHENEEVIIAIADSGPGVPLDDRQRIFEKFAQIKGHERRGAGLGLTFCKMVTEAHGGQLTVEDSSLGGALFILCLPTWEDPSDDNLSYSPVNDFSLANAPHS